MTNQIPAPVQEPIARPRRPAAELKRAGITEDQRDPLEGLVSDPWARYFIASGEITNAAPTRKAVVALTGQNASIGSTAIQPGATSAGLYRLNYYTRVTTAAGVSSSLTVSVGYTDHTVALTLTGAALTGNTISTLQQNTLLFYSDANAPITYSTTYASNAAGAMIYELYIVLEAVSL